MTGACEQARLEVTSPDAGVVVGVRSAVPVVARLVHDGGTVNARVPVTTDYDAQAANIPFPGGTTLMAPMTARRATYKFGWDGGPREDREVEVHGCNMATCAAWQSCTPTLDGGTCVAAVTGLQFVSPDGGTYGPSAPLTVAVAVTMVDGGVFSEDVPVVGPSGPAVLMGMGPVKTLVTTTPVVGGAFTWRTAFDGGVSATGTGVVDAVGPSLTFAPQGPGPYLRDALVRVEVRANEALAGPPEVLLAGSDAGVRYVSAAACSGNCGSARCDCVELDMAAPVLPMLTGSFTLSGSARDVVNNAGGGTGGMLAVTRLRWANPLPGVPTRLAPVAVSRSGVVIVATDETPTTTNPLRVFAFSPDGGSLWPQLQSGTVTAGPVVGASQVWLGTNDGTRTALLPVALSGGAAGTAQCDPVSTNTFNGDMALATVTGGEVVMGIRNGRLESTRAAACDAPYLFSPIPTDATSRPTVAVQATGGQGVEAYVAYEGDTRLWKAGANGPTWMGQGDVLLPGGPQQTKSLLFDGMGRVGGGGVGNGTYFMTSAVGALQSTNTVNTINVTNGSPAAHGAGVLFYGTSAGAVGRIQVQPGGGLADGGVASVTGIGSLQAPTPVLGNGVVYLMGASGTLTVRRQSDLSEVWSGSLATLTGQGTVAQPALDVYRDGAGNKVCPTGTPTTRPALGVLYVLTRSGAVATLRAILVDSPGLDNTAPWPKYQRDNANTGNINSDISPWTCP